MPSFKTQPIDTPMSEFAMRITVVEVDEDWEIIRIYWLGTCISISSNLVMTAKHVIDQYMTDAKKMDEGKCWIWILQILNIESSCSYAIWEIEDIWTFQNTDIALLHLLPYNEEAGIYMKDWRHMWIDIIPPPVWSRVVWFWYHNSEGKVTRNDSGGVNIAFDDVRSVTAWEVIEIYEPMRDRIMNPYPCYRVNTKFELGMSGGPIMNGKGKVCGIICSSFKENNSSEDAISYVSTLWPIMGISVQTKLLSLENQKESIRMLELAKRWFIQVENWQRVKLNQDTMTIEIDKYLETEEYKYPI